MSTYKDIYVVINSDRRVLSCCRSCNRLVIPKHIREQMHFMALIKSRKRSGFIQIYNTMHLQRLRGTICQ